MPFVDSAGARIHWQSEGQGTPVLLIMGHLYESSMWYPLVPSLTRQHRAIWFDNRGTGESATTKDATIAQFAADALAVLDAAGVEKAHVYGVSLGGGIAAEFAMRYPERTLSLILGCTAMKTEASVIPLAARLLYRLPRSWFHAALMKRSTPASFGSAAPAAAVETARQAMARLRFTMAGVRAQLHAIAAYATTREAVGRLKMPVLVLHGDEDKAVPLAKGQEFAAAIPHSQLIVYKGAGHNYLVAKTEESTAAALDFFAAVDGERVAER